MDEKIIRVIKPFLLYLICNMLLVIIWLCSDIVILNIIVSWIICPVQIITLILSEILVSDCISYSIKNLGILMVTSIIEIIICFTICELIFKVILFSVLLFEIGVFLIKVIIGNEEDDD